MGPYDAGAPHAYEVRALWPGHGGGYQEDAATGSLNAAVAQWLVRSGQRQPGTAWSVSQGQRMGRRAVLSIRVSADGDSSDGSGPTVWVGGHVHACVAGVLRGGPLGVAPVAVLATGGTIDKGYPRATGGYAFEIDTPAATRILDAVQLRPAVHVEQVLKKDSTEITEADRALIATRVTALASARCTRIVITHGTDTMVETAEYLHARCVALGVRVVLCGAKLPQTFKGSDAEFNLGFAFGAVTAASESGAFLAMGGAIYRAGHVERDSANGSWREK